MSKTAKKKDAFNFVLSRPKGSPMNLKTFRLLDLQAPEEGSFELSGGNLHNFTACSDDINAADICDLYALEVGTEFTNHNGKWIIGRHA
jgi:hypothetical protein